MDKYFIFQCTFVVVSTMLVLMYLGPVLWDTAGYVEEALNNVYNIEGMLTH